MTTTIYILAYDGVQILDIAGPSAVFEEAAHFVRTLPYRVQVVTPSGAGLGAGATTSGGLTMAAAPLPTPAQSTGAVLLVPGGTNDGLRQLITNAATRRWAEETLASFTRVLSVCTGAFVLADWGWLDGRRAATHWQAADDLARRYPAITVDRDALFVEDGPVWTSAGVSTGIDMALALVERDLGRDVAMRVARRLVLPMRRPGHQSQFSAMLEAQDGEYGPVLTWVRDNLHQDVSLEALAQRAGQSPRTFHRRFKAATGMTPAVFVERLRLDHARLLLEAGRAPKHVARAAGFGSLDHMTRAFRRTHGMTPSLYRAIHAPAPGEGGAG